MINNECTGVAEGGCAGTSALCGIYCFTAT